MRDVTQSAERTVTGSSPDERHLWTDERQVRARSDGVKRCVL